MIEERLDGDIYMLGVRVYNGKRQAPVRWAAIVLDALVFVVLMAFLTIWLSV